MGIEGLLPFLDEASTHTHIKNYRGYSAAVDGSTWLYRGAYSCAVKLGLGESTDAYVVFCIKYVDLLLQNGIRPVIVFDGRSLISKEVTHRKRRERREVNRKTALKLVKEGDRAGSWSYFVKSLEITHEMIYAWIKVLRERQIDYIVAPFEADAQLAYLARKRIVQLVITEDSDLAVYGCPQLCVLYNPSKIHLCLGVSAREFRFDNFRYMCIISGCDYLKSLPGIGLARAQKVVDGMTASDTITKVIKSTLNLRIEVPDEYIVGFSRADNTFLYQLVFDPITRQIVPLNPYGIYMDPNEMPYAGTYDLDDATAFQMAIGNIDTKTLKTIDDSFKIDGYAGRGTSIWSKKYVIPPPPPKNRIKELNLKKHSSVESKGVKAAAVSVNKNLATKKRSLLAEGNNQTQADAKDPLKSEIIQLAALYAQDESVKTIKIEGNDTNGITRGEVNPQINGQHSFLASKRVKISTSTTTSVSLRNKDSYNMGTTQNSANSPIFLDAPQTFVKHELSKGNKKPKDLEVAETSRIKDLLQRKNFKFFRKN